MTAVGTTKKMNKKRAKKIDETMSKLHFERNFPSLKMNVLGGAVGIKHIQRECLDKDVVLKSFKIIEERLKILPISETEKEHINLVIADEIKELGLKPLGIKEV